MNAGFSNLGTLKKLLLANTLKADTRFDGIIAAIGLGVAGQFENLCNRKFCYATGVVETFPADRAEFLLTQTPLQAVTGWAIKWNEQDGWTAQDVSCIRFIDLGNGIVMPRHDRDVGPWHAQVQFTYTGGYWWEQLEEGDPNYGKDQPSGAPLLPNDLLNAWTMQVRHLWRNVDKLGKDILKDGDSTSIALPDDFAPTVQMTLKRYVRYKIT